MGNLLSWSRKHGIVFSSPEKILDHPKVIEHYKSIVEKYNQHFNPVEQVKKFELINAEWTINGGELTPTLKLKRKVIMEKHADAIERIYGVED
jgi:long-chain acyl-CoA synthetase